MTSKFAKKLTSSDLSETWYDDMTFKVIRGQGQGEEMTSVPYRDYFYQEKLPFNEDRDRGLLLLGHVTAFVRCSLGLQFA